mgnify:FL=1
MILRTPVLSLAVLAGLVQALAASCTYTVTAPPLTEPPVIRTTTTASVPLTQAPDPMRDGPDRGVIDQTWPAVARVTGLGCTASQVGTGFVAGEGLVVTVAHVVAGLSAPEVHLPDISQVASIVAFNPVSDLAVLSVDTGSLRPLTLADGSPGQAVAILAFDEDGEPETTRSRVIRRVRAVGDDIYGEPGDGRDALELEASVRSGNSGAPVVDEAGYAVGVVFSRTRGGIQVAYAVQSTEVRTLLESALRNGGEPVDSGECRPR